jgi:dTDP-4-amino-4,6-dideoxygalactose transaminase
MSPSDQLRINGATAAPSTGRPLLVGRPNVGDLDAFRRRMEEMLERRWFSNDGPFVKEFEQALADRVGVRHCVTACNATVAMEIVARALEVQGEVIVPAYTFVATAHAFRWQEITPVFADMDPATHNIDPSAIERLITPRTSAIVATHVWGRPCDTDAIEAIARRHDLRVVYDAAHAFGSSRRGRMIGQHGDCEVFSFHATKFLNSFEGGAVATNDDQLAERIRLMRNFGFSGFDNVVHLGTNGKMTEVCAAMGLTSLDAMEEIIDVNRRNHEAYRRGLEGARGIRLLDYDASERNNHQYVVIEVDPTECGVDRDGLVDMLHENGVVARRYFWPGVHRMKPYRDEQPNARLLLPNTERIARRVVVLPTGQQVQASDIEHVCELVRTSASSDVDRSRVTRAA